MNTTTQMPMVVPDASAERAPGLTSNGLSIALALAIAGVGGAMCLLRPDRIELWIAAMAFLPLVLLGVRLLCGGAGSRASDQYVRSPLQRTICGAGVLVFIPLLLRLVEALGVVEFAAASRSIGVTLGVGVALAGGYLARKLVRLVSSRVGPSTAASVLRFASLGIMAGGFAYAFLWLVAPLTVANLWASCALGAAALLVVARSFVTLRLGDRR